MGGEVLGIHEVDRTMVAVAGGKGANLGELTRIDEVTVPPGFVVTTAAWDRVVAGSPTLADRLAMLERTDPGDPDAHRTICEDVRRSIEAIVLPDDLEHEVAARLAHDAE